MLVKLSTLNAGNEFKTGEPLEAFPLNSPYYKDNTGKPMCQHVGTAYTFRVEYINHCPNGLILVKFNHILPELGLMSYLYFGPDIEVDWVS